MAVQNLNAGTGSVQLLGDVPVGTVVKINESGSPAEFIVIQQGSPSDAYVGFDGGTVVHRKFSHSNGMFDSQNNDYANSDLNLWGNSDYFNMLDANIQEHVMQIKIPYRKGTSGTTASSGENGLSCKVFFLSANELNHPLSNQAVLGTAMAYYIDPPEPDPDLTKSGWTRTPTAGTSDWAWFTNGNGEMTDGTYAWIQNAGVGRYPNFVLQSTLYVLPDGTIAVSQPPTAPATIDVTGVVSGGEATITLTAATDPDPDESIASYVYERSVDGGQFVQFANVNSLTTTDSVQSSWGTVAYRAAAVDNYGLQGPYVTGETEVVNDGWLLIGGPVSNLGVKSLPFDFEVTIGVSGQSDVKDIAVQVKMDGDELYNDTVNQGAKITIPIDTRVLGSGQHDVQVIASKDDYLSAAAAYVFKVPSYALPAEGRSQQLEGPDGQPIFPFTSSRNVIGPGGVSIQTEVEQIKKSNRGPTGHLAFIDSLLGPISGYELAREENTAYAVQLFAPASSPDGEAVVCVYAGYTGQLGTYLNAESEKLTFTVPANAILSIYKFVLDALPAAEKDLTVNFTALEQPKVLTAATNTGTAASNLNDALKQMMDAFPVQNYYALTDTDGAVTYYIACSDRITDDTASVSSCAYVSSADPTKWYQGVQVQLLNTNNIPGLFTYLNPPLVASVTSSNSVSAGTTLNDTLLAMIKAQPSYYRYQMEDNSGTRYYVLSPTQLAANSLTASNVLYCTIGGTYYSGETMELGVTKLFTEMNWPPVIEFGTENPNVVTGRSLEDTIQAMLEDSQYFYLYALWDGTNKDKRVYIASPTEITSKTINKVTSVSYVKESAPERYYKLTNITLPWITMTYIGKYTSTTQNTYYTNKYKSLADGLISFRDTWNGNPQTHETKFYYVLDPDTLYPKAVFDGYYYDSDTNKKTYFTNIGQDTINGDGIGNSSSVLYTTYEIVSPAVNAPNMQYEGAIGSGNLSIRISGYVGM